MAYKADKSDKKIDLGVGAYRTDEEKPYVFAIVKKIEKEVVNDLTLNKVYFYSNFRNIYLLMVLQNIMLVAKN